MSSRWGTAPWCWTVRWRGRGQSPLPGDRTAFPWRLGSGRQCSVTALCSSETSPRDERITRLTQENTTAPHRTVTACWSAARPESCSHVSHMTTAVTYQQHTKYILTTHWQHTDNILITHIQHYVFTARLPPPPPALPKFLSHPDSMAVDEGGVARLTCQVNGIPEANITWQRDRRPLSTEDPRYVYI